MRGYIGGICIAFTCFAGTAHAAEYWSCTFPDFSPQHTATIVTYLQEGDDLIETMPSFVPGALPEEHMTYQIVSNMTYRIVSNTTHGLVAAQYLEDKTQSGSPVVGVLLVVINKASGAYKRAAMFAPSDVPAANGSCIRG